MKEQVLVPATKVDTQISTASGSEDAPGTGAVALRWNNLSGWVRAKLIAQDKITPERERPRGRAQCQALRRALHKAAQSNAMSGQCCEVLQPPTTPQGVAPLGTPTYKGNPFAKRVGLGGPFGFPSASFSALPSCTYAETPYSAELFGKR